MDYATLGRTGIRVSRLCLGTMTWGKQNSRAEAHAQIDMALDAGVNFLDTAEAYAIPPAPETYGTTETIIGEWFAADPSRRGRVVLASKISGGGQSWIRGGSVPSAATIREALDGSLRRLRTDYIDLYQIHWPARGHFHFDTTWRFRAETQDRSRAMAQMHEGLDTLDALVGEGKIRAVGLSNESAWGIAQFLRLSEIHSLVRIATTQNEYSLLRRHFDLDLAELSHHEDVGLLAYSPLGAGVITGKYLDGHMPEGSRGAVSGGLWRANQYSEPAVRAYLDLARRHGLDVAQMAIAFTLTRPFVTATIIGATTTDQLRTNLGAADLTLSPDVLADIEATYRWHPRPL